MYEEYLKIAVFYKLPLELNINIYSFILLILHVNMY